MTRRRFRATPAPAVPSGFAIGVTMTPVAPASAPVVAAREAVCGEVTGPVVIGGNPGGGYPCTWLVFMRGVFEGDEIEWIAEWAGMDGDYIGSVTFGVSDETASQPMIAQILNSESGSIDWIDITAIVNGTTYGPERVSCVA